MEEIKNWIQKNLLQVEWLSEEVFTVNGKLYQCIDHKEGKIFNENFELIFNEKDLYLLEHAKAPVSYFVFEFGGKVYYSATDADRTQLNLLKHIGRSTDSGFPYLGVHGGYELCSGSRSYDDWVKKAKWLGIGVLGMCETHTLAGAIRFQNACKKGGVKSIIGETVKIKSGDRYYSVKLYVANYKGWRNLLRIHKRLGIDNGSQFVEEDFLLQNTAGLYLVFCADTMLSVDTASAFVNLYDFHGVFFQYDPVLFKTDQRDLQHLQCLKNYLGAFKAVMPLALICDSYYLDAEDFRVRRLLSFVGKGNNNQSDDQCFKSLEDVTRQSLELFQTKGEEFSFDILGAAIDGLEVIVAGCDFKIPLGEIHLPKYEMTPEEKERFETNEDLFYTIIEEGIAKSGEAGADVEAYLNRVETELQVITAGNFIDYFLIVRDIINWAEANNIMVGTGRGSISGSLVAYFCNLTKVDAMEYNLIFERFLNMSRVGKGLPDVDSDFVSARRDDVKRYMEQRFGVHNVCAIGAYTTLKLKAAFKEVIRFQGETTPADMNFFSGFISESGSDFSALFHEAASSKDLKDFIDTQFEAINNIDLVLGQPKSASVHASGVILAPKEKDGEPMEVYDWMPCKKMDGIVVSEWEGVPLDDAGFLKADILGLNQLDKLQATVDLIKERTGKKIDLNSIDKNDKSVFELFGKGMNQDVFQFGTDGLSAYCREVKPESILELAAINALYRPGAMDSGAHIDYVKIKFGKKEAEYDWGCEEITKSTNGLLIYQEQAIFIVQKVGGLSLTDGDGVRKATGKKDLEKMKSYKEKFVAGAINNGCPEFEANKIWNKIEVFAEYSFNLSHAVAYSLIGYQTQWLKRHYPLAFWTVSLQFADDDEVSKRISELNKFEGIKLNPPDINKSRESFYTDWDAGAIYWSLSRISHVAEKALGKINSERERGGAFFSLEEFISRTKGMEVNSRVVKHLILSGCFDELHGISFLSQRMRLIQEFCTLYKIDLPLEFTSDKIYGEFFWYKMQRDLCGYGYFDYTKTLGEMGYRENEVIGPADMQLSDNEGWSGNVCGILTDTVKRRTKKGEMCKLTLDCNNELVDVVLWNDQWIPLREEIEKNIGNGIVISGDVKYDAYNKKNVLYCNSDTVMKAF